MENWTGWAAAGLGFILSLLGMNIRMDKKRHEENAKDCARRDSLLAERLAIIESITITEKEVRLVVKEYYEPVLAMQSDITEIKIALAHLPKRKED